MINCSFTYFMFTLNEISSQIFLLKEQKVKGRTSPEALLEEPSMVAFLAILKKPVGLTVHSNAAGLAPSHSQILQCAAVCVCLPLRPLARYYAHSGAGGYNSHLHFYYEYIY